MLRFVAITAVAAALSSPAFAEPGFVKTVSLPAFGLVPKAACELPVDLSVHAAPAAAASQAVTLSPRMIQAIRIDGDAPTN